MVTLMTVGVGSGYCHELRAVLGADDAVHPYWELTIDFLSQSHWPLILHSTTMLQAIISPSVLASDFGQLTAECKRMIKGGAEWLHMGSSHISNFLM